MAELAQAKAQADLLNDPAAGWLVTLDDGMGDLRTDIDYDLAGRLRTVTRQAEERIATTDPADGWDEFAAWLEQTGDGRRRRDYLALSTGAEALAARVAERFEAAEAEHRCDPRRGDRAGDRQRPRRRRRGSRRLGASQRGVLLLEGSWTGIEAFSMVGGLIGLSLLRPVVVGARDLHRPARAARGEATSAREPSRAGPSIGLALLRRGHVPSEQGRPGRAAPHPQRVCAHPSRPVPARSRGRSPKRSGPPSRPASRPPTRSRSTPSSRRCSSSPRVSRPPAADRRPRPGVRFVQDPWHRRVVRSSHDHSLQRHWRRRGRHGSVAGVLSPARAQAFPPPRTTSRMSRSPCPAVCASPSTRSRPSARSTRAGRHRRAGIAWLSRSVRQP